MKQIDALINADITPGVDALFRALDERNTLQQFIASEGSLSSFHSSSSESAEEESFYGKNEKAAEEHSAVFEESKEPKVLREPNDEDFLAETAGTNDRLRLGSIIAREIRRLLFERLGFTVSAGIGPNKALAKLVSSCQKPDGQTLLLPSAAKR